MYLGIDLGTSAVKAVVTDDGVVVAEASERLDVSRPGPRMSEQAPEDWWRAADAAVRRLKHLAPKVDAIGLSGQMHGAVLLDSGGLVLRNAILWNDGRSEAECAELEGRLDVPGLTGNRAMPGFTAPKLLWVRRHEPAVFARIKTVLLPKDYLRYRMTGELASDMSDASGTLWLDVGGRRFSKPMLDATGLDESHMPRLVEGTEVAGVLRRKIADEWGLKPVPVVGGGGDQAAGAVGAGAVVAGTSFVSLGTSGVYFVPDSTYRPNPDGGVHAFCHALPGMWHQMSVVLSAASALTWVTRLTGAASEAAVVDEVEASGVGPSSVYFLPYLSGERTPHNDPNALGAFVGLDHDVDRARLVYAVLEGVAFAVADGQRVLEEAGANIGEVTVIGGGSRSTYWGRILSAALGRPLTYREDAAVGPALGAARLAALGHAGGSPAVVCPQAPVVESVEASPEAIARSQARFATYRALYRDLKERFPALHDA
ncbi:MAG: xylulokinase [Gammaproteobacteria bacterium]|nr:xylulokinase [Gammaproteobacteria bacterium]